MSIVLQGLVLHVGWYVENGFSSVTTGRVVTESKKNPTLEIEKISHARYSATEPVSSHTPNRTFRPFGHNDSEQFIFKCKIMTSNGNPSPTVYSHNLTDFYEQTVGVIDVGFKIANSSEPNLSYFHDLL